jgi:protein-L-isoaspartate(D-aspartate) O-methyltransferase
VGIDRDRMLNNGLPSFLAFQIEAARIGPKDRVVHIGCGVGYYSAVMAELAHEGSVLAIETDPELSERSRENLKGWHNVEVVTADGTQYDPGLSDVIFVNAGVTHPEAKWLQRLRDSGRLVLPLTHRKNEMITQGILLLVERGQGLVARAISHIYVYDCVGGRDDRWNDALGEALQRDSADHIRSLRPVDHGFSETCWVHVADVCVSMIENSD